MTRLIKWTRSVLALLGALAVITLLFPPRWYANLLAGPWPDAKGAVLVVLAGDSSSYEILGESSYWRAFYTVLTWREGGFRKIIISGQGSGPMRDFVVSQGVPAEAIILEDKSVSTHENALFTAQAARQLSGPVVLLTSDFHMFRAHRAFTKAGLTVIPSPFPDALKRFNSWRWRWVVTIELMEETGKIVYYWARGWI